jgi:pantoate--beta-alanine ligase
MNARILFYGIYYFYQHNNGIMKIFRTKKTFTDYIERQKEMGKKIGFAPTMGALHQGHLSLYTKANKENDLVISSIFVNPTQFNNASDLEKYPRDPNRDIKMLENSGAVHAVYLPEIADLYPEGLESKCYDFDGLENEMEGKFRPGHFDGVGTVVEELLRQAKPDNAYFGEKDYQQLIIIGKLVEKLALPVKIHGVAIYREENGLAMSSRNERLSESQREASKVIYETLLKVNDWFRIVTVQEINNRVKDIFEDQRGMTLEYFMIADEKTLRETDFFYKGHHYRAFIVVFANEVRLIDNLHLD